MNNVRVATVQMEHASGDKAANLEKIREFAEAAARQLVRIIAFPECCITGYWFLRHLTREQLAALAEPVPGGSSTQALLALAARHGMTIGAGLVEIDGEGHLYNTYVVAMPDGQVRRHRKLHAFVSEHLTSGDEYTVFDTPHGVRVGVLTCYDNNIIENVRVTALMGAEVLLAPHQTGGCRSRNQHSMSLVDPELWRNRHADPQAVEEEFRSTKGRAWLMRWLPARAHDNSLFLIFSNGVGMDDNEVRTGNATILDPYGRILVETWEAADKMLVADLDASLLENATGAGWIRTRRPELYKPLAEPTGREIPTRTARMSLEK